MKGNKIRIIIYGFICVVCLSLGTVGVIDNIQKNSLTKEEKVKVNNIVEKLNNSLIVKEYNNVGVTINAKKKQNKIIIKYIGSVNEEKYTITYKDDLLYFNYDSKDTVARTVFNILLDVVGIINGTEEKQVFASLQNVDLSSYTIENGLSYVNNNNTINSIININIPITSYNSSIITVKDLNNNLVLLKEGNLTLYKTDLSLLIYKNKTDYIISLKEATLTNTTYTSLINILELVLNDEDLNKFKNIYTDANSLSNSTDGIKIELNPKLTTKEEESFNKVGPIIRVSIPLDKLK